MKIATIIGARPQFIKAAVVSQAVSLSQTLEEVVIHTGQHYDKKMSEIFFSELNIPSPRYNLGVGGGTHGQNTGRMVESLESTLINEKPDWVLVYGDTDSTLAGAIAACKLKIPIAHVEAGLRSFNKEMPEELNRVLTDHASTMLFAPTEQAIRNLKCEGLLGEKVQMIGDVMYDAALYYSDYAKMPKFVYPHNLQNERFCLLTVHRAENADNPERLTRILGALGAFGEKFLWPIHPRTYNCIKFSNVTVPKNVIIVDPVGYLEMVWLEKNCNIVVTDSGGVQKEAYFHGKPCIVLRKETEWTELVGHSLAKLVDADEILIQKALAGDWDIKSSLNRHLFGDGKSALKVADYFARLAI